MTAWNDLLSHFPRHNATGGAVLQDLEAEASAASVVCPLTDHAVLSVIGEDASKFLQGQTTTDFREITAGQSRLGCYVNLKGRAIATFRAITTAQGVDLILRADLLPSVRERLGKYIVFSKATLRPADDVLLMGVAGPDAPAALAKLGLLPIDQTDTVGRAGDLTLVRLHGDQRWLLQLPAARQAEILEVLNQTLAPAGTNAWTLRQIAAGEPDISLATSERLQPQELNGQLLGAVSYTKGCYTGQEIVARLHFRGKLKQHMQRLEIDGAAPLRAGQMLTDQEGKSLGEVVLAASRTASQQELLAVLRPDEIGQVRVDGVALTALPLPYEIPTTDA